MNLLIGALPSGYRSSKKSLDPARIITTFWLDFPSTWKMLARDLQSWMQLLSSKILKTTQHFEVSSKQGQSISSECVDVIDDIAATSSDLNWSVPIGDRENHQVIQLGVLTAISRSCSSSKVLSSIKTWVLVRMKSSVTFRIFAIRSRAEGVLFKVHRKRSN